MNYDCAASGDERNGTALGPLHIDYLYLHYCVFAGLAPVSFAALFLWLCALFFFLGSTADGYFSPTLASISDKLQIPYDIAGVTFLAFGNGAPDVFSSIAAYSSGVGEAGINELLGGSMFVSNVVVGCVAISSTVNVQQWAFTRDVCALLASLVLLLVLALRERPSDHDGRGPDGVELLLLAMYVAYVSSVVVPECISRFRVARQQVQRSGNDTTIGVLSAFWHALSPRGASTGSSRKVDDASLAYAFVTKPAERGARSFELSSPRAKAPTFPGAVVEDHFQDVSDELTSPLISDEERTVSSEDNGLVEISPEWVRFSNGAQILESAYWRHLRWRWRLKRRIGQVIGGSDSFLVRMLSVPNAVLILIRDVSVPLLDAESWSRSIATISPVTVPLLVLLTSGQIDATVGKDETPLWILLVSGGIFAAVLVSYTTHRSRAPESSPYCAFFLVLAFISCVCWIYTIANELVALLVAVGTITHASNSLLGLTVLSWGNSVGDLITNVSVARAGFPEMAIAGCFGGPVFNILLGLGIPMMLAYFRGEVEHLIFDIHAWISLGFLSIMLITSLVVIRHCGYHCPPWYGKIQLGVYGLYTITNIVLAIQNNEAKND